jgi:hypothetical protein
VIGHNDGEALRCPDGSRIHLFSDLYPLLHQGLVSGLVLTCDSWKASRDFGYAGPAVLTDKGLELDEIASCLSEAIRGFLDGTCTHADTLLQRVNKCLGRKTAANRGRVGMAFVLTGGVLTAVLIAQDALEDRWPTSTRPVTIDPR